MRKILTWLGFGRKPSFEELYLSRSVDRADFAAREKRLAYKTLNEKDLYLL